MTATLADLRELSRSFSAFAAFQLHFLSTFAAISSSSKEIFSAPAGTKTARSSRAFKTDPLPEPLSPVMTTSSAGRSMARRRLAGSVFSVMGAASRLDQIEIPIADTLADSERLVKVQRETGVVCMGGHTRRFNPSHQYVHKKIKAGELKVQQMNVQTYFFRRTNMNAAGKPRSWTDHLLWHHACHTVDLFQYQTGELVSECYGVQGPIHPELKIAMDMGIVLKTPSGAICTLSLSFNNKGPLGTFFRYICDNGTFIARYDDLLDGEEKLQALADSIRERGPRAMTSAYSSAVARRYMDFKSPLAAYAKIPRPYVIVQRINLGLFAILGEMHATADWRGISEEIWPFVQAPPSTPMGEAEAPWLARARA